MTSESPKLENTSTDFNRMLSNLLAGDDVPDRFFKALPSDIPHELVPLPDELLHAGYALHALGHATVYNTECSGDEEWRCTVLQHLSSIEHFFWAVVMKIHQLASFPDGYTTEEAALEKETPTE